MAEKACEANNWFLTSEELEAIKAAFTQYDQNGDGTISATEFQTLSEDLGEKLEGNELDEAVRALDKDKSGVIEFEEFLEWWQETDD